MRSIYGLSNPRRGIPPTVTVLPCGGLTAGFPIARSVDLTVECFNLRPWARYSSVQYEFYAVDSLGNRYEAFPDAWRDGSEPMLLWTGNINTGVCTVTHICSLMGYCSQGAEWIELRYDRAGRDVRLRVYLPGGDAA